MALEVDKFDYYNTQFKYRIKSKDWKAVGQDRRILVGPRVNKESPGRIILHIGKDDDKTGGIQLETEEVHDLVNAILLSLTEAME